MMSTDAHELERLRRQVRAMGAVNRQLHAQLEGVAGGSVVTRTVGPNEDLLAPADRASRATGTRRVAEASVWVEQLARHPRGGRPVLVRAASGKVYVVEGEHRREVRAGLLVPALELVLGDARSVEDSELDGWIESTPVEVLEARKGTPFVIVGGRRHPIRGLPLPHQLRVDTAQVFLEGPELNVAATNVSRARFEAAVFGRYQAELLRSVVRRRGLVGGARAIARRVNKLLRARRSALGA